MSSEQRSGQASRKSRVASASQRSPRPPFDRTTATYFILPGTDCKLPAQVQAQLHATLKQVTIALPPHRHKLTAAHCDHLSAMIESSLVKMSLLRARAHRSLYGTTSQNGTEPEHEANFRLALGTAYRKLNAEEALMLREEKELDKKLAEYEDLLNAVDGDSGGFQQVVNDWTKVRKETEECRRDLRRLGWTGD